ncbi:MAG: sulfite exporter TauE/SafE family protein [Hyphomicrobiaceae bacterium]
MLLEPQLAAILVTGLIAAGIVKGATGLGYASCALPFLVYAVGLKTAISLVLVPAMATNIAVALGNGHLRETWRDFAVLYVAMLPGIAAGLALLWHIDGRRAVGILGSVVIGYSLLALLRPGWRIGSRAASLLMIPVGLLNGFLTGLTGSQVLPLVPYVLALDLSPARSVQAINLGVTLASATMLIGVLATGLVDGHIIALSVLAIVPALLGAEIGRRLRARIPAERVRSAILIVLLVSGIGMLMR